MPAAKVRDFQQVVSESHFKQRENWIHTNLKKTNKKYLVPSLSFKIKENSIDNLSSPPEIGENTEEILSEFGFSKVEILDLFIKKIAY